jgi:VanZ family protein
MRIGKRGRNLETRRWIGRLKAPSALTEHWLSRRHAAVRANASRIACLPVNVARAAVPLALVIYALGLLWPFEFRVPARVANGAVWTEAATLRFEAPGLALSPAPPVWQEASRKAGSFRVSIRARSFSPNQNGPARLFTLARDTYFQNLVIGQAGDDLVVRLRGLCRILHAHGRTCPKQLRVPAVFAASEWVDLDLRVEPGRISLRAGSGPSLELSTVKDPLRGWDPQHRLALGNDVSGLRPWLGELARVTVRTPLGEENWLDPAKLGLPGAFWLLDRQPKLEPFYHVPFGDVIINILLYMPFTILIAGCFRRYGTYSFLLTTTIVFLTSASFEVGQLFVETRNFSLTDIFLNVAGGFVTATLLLLLASGWRQCQRVQ